MRWTDDDKEIIANIVRKEVQPIRDMTLEHRQTLYGENGNNGLRGDVKALKKVYTWVSGTIAVIVVAGEKIVEKIFIGK